MSDTTTTLNPGAAGDKMDESQVLQSDGVTSAKRPRVVIGGDAGYNGSNNDIVQPVKADPGANPMVLPVMGLAVVSDTINSYVDNEVRPMSLTTEGRLRVSVVPARLATQTMDEDQQCMWGECHIGGPASPWEGW